MLASKPVRHATLALAFASACFSDPPPVTSGGGTIGGDASSTTAGDSSGGDASEAGGGPCDGEGGCDPDATCQPDPSGEQAVCTCKPGFVGDGTTCDVEPALATLRVEVPCKDGMFLEYCDCDPGEDSTIMLGEPGAQFTVTLWIRGVIEVKSYTCETQDGFWCANGTGQDGNNWSDTELAISSPPQTYRLNADASESSTCVVVDMKRDVLVDVGATVGLRIDPIDGSQAQNDDNAVVMGIPPAPAAFDGQFLQVDAIAIMPAP